MKAARRPFVLLVEDDPADANLVEEALVEAHVECGLKVVGDGTKALEFFSHLDQDETACPDLVILDLNLPRLSGEEVLKRLRTSTKYRSVKVLIITSSNAVSDRERAMKLGATDYFRKPSSLEQFLELGPKVRRVLESGPGPSTGPAIDQ